MKSTILFTAAIFFLVAFGCNRSSDDRFTDGIVELSNKQFESKRQLAIQLEDAKALEKWNNSEEKKANNATEAAFFSKAPITPEESRNAWLNLNSETVNWAYTKVSEESSKAFIDLYGSVEWSDKSLAEYFPGEKIGYITPKFEEKFTEDGKEKLLVLGYITPKPAVDYSCHACVPLLGGAIFVKQENGWIAESVNKIIGWGDVLEIGRFGLVLIGPKKYGVAFYFMDSHQGYEDLRAGILVPHNGGLVAALNEGFNEGLGEGVGCNTEVASQKVDIKFEPGKDSNYFDAIVQVQFNEGNCEKFTRKDKTTRYQLHDGKYEPI